MRATVLTVRGLTVDVPPPTRRARSVRLVDHVDLTLRAGERLALVGESGSGKSVTARALMRLTAGLRVGGSVRLGDRELLTLPDREMARVRGAEIAMVLQDPLTALNPVMTIGDQVAEPLRIRGVPRRAAHAQALEALQRLRVPRAAERLDAYPQEFSGGMRQRVVLAAAMIAQPTLLIADEPTTALDVRVQQQVLDLIAEVSDDMSVAVLLITHDLGAVAGFADRVAVMYAGRMVEERGVDGFFAGPRHPYADALLRSVPRTDGDPARPLSTVPGAPASPTERPPGCAFHPRCVRSEQVCREQLPETVGDDGERVACHRPMPASMAAAR
ncbi:ABC transporter ATP-binding protein [Uniformispora flossi]|uniref:ABC transporter ATP-binding protein n=1 Tax=Uniformispora flossi TaxID=3390723 RepID=UPI003C2C1586